MTPNNSLGGQDEPTTDLYAGTGKEPASYVPDSKPSDYTTPVVSVSPEVLTALAKGTATTQIKHGGSMRIHPKDLHESEVRG